MSPCERLQVWAEQEVDRTLEFYGSEGSWQMLVRTSGPREGEETMVDSVVAESPVLPTKDGAAADCIVRVAAMGVDVP